MVEKIFSEYKAALREVLENKRVEKKHLAFLDDFDRDSEKIEEIIIKSMKPYVHELYSAIQEFTQMQSSPVEDLIADPKNFDELFNEIKTKLKPDFFEVDIKRKLLREKLVTYLKQLQIMLYELIPRIELQHTYVEYLKSELAVLQEKVIKLKEKSRGVVVG